MWKFNNNKAKIFNLFNAERDDDHSKSMPSAQLLFSCRTKNAPFEFDHNEIIDKRWSLQNIRERERNIKSHSRSPSCVVVATRALFHLLTICGNRSFAAYLTTTRNKKKEEEEKTTSENSNKQKQRRTRK